MYLIKLMKKSTYPDFDEIIEFNNEDKAHFAYLDFMNKPYYFGSFVKIVNGREENRASFCNSEFA